MASGPSPAPAKSRVSSARLRWQAGFRSITGLLRWPWLSPRQYRRMAGQWQVVNRLIFEVDPSDGGPSQPIANWHRLTRPERRGLEHGTLRIRRPGGQHFSVNLSAGEGSFASAFGESTSAATISCRQVDTGILGMPSVPSSDLRRVFGGVSVMGGPSTSARVFAQCHAGTTPCGTRTCVPASSIENEGGANGDRRGRS